METQSTQGPCLLFVYNADTGLFNTLADIGHKIFSPSTYQCDLCMLTHGYFSERGEWRSFIENLGIEANFLHRDEFHRQFPAIDVPLPAVFLQQDGETRVCINARSLHDCKSVGDLQALIRIACQQALN